MKQLSGPDPDKPYYLDLVTRLGEAESHETWPLADEKECVNGLKRALKEQGFVRCEVRRR